MFASGSSFRPSTPTSARSSGSQKPGKKPKRATTTPRQPHGIGRDFTDAMEGPSSPRAGPSRSRASVDDEAILDSPLKRGFRYLCNNFIPSFGTGVACEECETGSPSRGPRRTYTAPGGLPGLPIDESEDESPPTPTTSAHALPQLRILTPTFLPPENKPRPRRPTFIHLEKPPARQQGEGEENDIDQDEWDRCVEEHLKRVGRQDEMRRRREEAEEKERRRKLAEEVEEQRRRAAEAKREELFPDGVRLFFSFGAQKPPRRREQRDGRQQKRPTRCERDYMEYVLREAQEQFSRKRDEARRERQRKDEEEHESADRKGKAREEQSEKRAEGSGPTDVDHEYEQVMKDLADWKARKNDPRPTLEEFLKFYGELEDILLRIKECNKRQSSWKQRQARETEDAGHRERREERFRGRGGFSNSRAEPPRSSRARFHPYAPASQSDHARSGIHGSPSGSSRPSHSSDGSFFVSPQPRAARKRTDASDNADANLKKFNRDVTVYLDWYDYEWTVVNSSSTSSSLSFSDIPWPVCPFPRSPKDVTEAGARAFWKQRCLLGSAPGQPDFAKQKRAILKRELLNWHPDKFSTRILSHAANSGELEAIQAAADVVQKALTAYINEPESAETDRRNQSR